MRSLADEIKKLQTERTSTRFTYLVRLCQEVFGGERISGSHHVFKMPWAGDPRINLQKDGNKAKPYQVDQVVDALMKLQGMKGKK